MKTRRYISIALVFLLGGGLLIAQQGGGGGQRNQSGQRQTTPRQAGGQGSRQGPKSGTMTQTRQQQRDRLRTQLTTQQRDQLGTCTHDMDRLRTRARDMAQYASGNSFNAQDARTQANQIRTEFQAMEQNRVQLRESLNAEQQSAVQQRDQKMTQLRDRIQTRLQTMDAELAKPDPNRKQVNKQARLTEQEMTRYHLQLREMGNDLGMLE